MDQNTNNCSDDSNASVRLTADGKINDYGPPPWPLAPWADSSYLPFRAPPAPNPDTDIRARVVRFIDREAARETPSSTDTSAANGVSPMEDPISEPTAPRPRAHQEAPAQDHGTSSRTATQRTRPATVPSEVERSHPAYLDDMNEWLRNHIRQRSREHARTLNGGRCESARPPTAVYGFGLRIDPPTSRADTVWPYNDLRLLQASMFDVNAILPRRSWMDVERERRENREAKEAFRKECEEKRRRRRDASH
ncbi:hypothetical protein MMC11_001487 [Xylographa trunciseda]|nr:hypothetical protein [Xylographa trunciseda]